MSLPVTYQSIINRVATWLENNCINSATKWSSCPAWCKSGYRTNWVYFAGTNTGAKGSRFRYVLQNGLSSGLSSNQILSQLNSFIDSKSANRSIYIPESELIDFVYDLGLFCAAHTYFMGNFNSDDPDNVSNGTAKVVRTKNTATYLVYDINGNPNNWVATRPNPSGSGTISQAAPVLALNQIAEYKVTEADDFNRIIDLVIWYINNNTRCVGAQYTISLAST